MCRLASSRLSSRSHLRYETRTGRRRPLETEARPQKGVTMSQDLSRLDATTLAELVREGGVSPLELVNTSIDGIERLNAQLNAVITPLYDKARQRARSGKLEGPFAGVPMLIKDLDVVSAGDPFHAGMKFLKEQGFYASHSSYMVELFERAGLIILGKTNTPELGLTVTTEPEAYGPSCNPWNPEHSTGGSSGGSGAAVASGMVPLAHAGDGGGSIRIPASECGLVGLKPSRGRCSLGPDYGEYWHGLVASMVVTRSVRDTAGILDVVSGLMPGDPYAAPSPDRPYTEEVGAKVGNLKVGVFAPGPDDAIACNPECAAAARDAGTALSELGHQVHEAYPSALDEQDLYRPGFFQIVACWTAKALEAWGKTTGRPVTENDVESTTWWLAEAGRAVSAAEYLATVEALHAWNRRMAEWWSSDFDLLVTPTIACPPPRLGYLSEPKDDPLEMSRKVLEVMAFTPQFNITGQPAMSVPLGRSDRGLPIGVQLVAAYGREDVLIRVASQLEEARPWSDRIPEIHVSAIL